MSDDASIEIEYEALPALKILLGRAPVLDRQQKLIGHELVFRSCQPDAARRELDTTNILAHAAETGMDNLAGTALGFITATAEFLEGESVLFLPQKSYLPIGSLRAAIAYPAAAAAYPDASIQHYLRLCRLPHLAGRLDEEDNWSQRLSPDDRLAHIRELRAALPAGPFTAKDIDAAKRAGRG